MMKSEGQKWGHKGARSSNARRSRWKNVQRAPTSRLRKRSSSSPSSVHSSPCHFSSRWLRSPQLRKVASREEDREGRRWGRRKVAPLRPYPRIRLVSLRFVFFPLFLCRSEDGFASGFNVIVSSLHLELNLLGDSLYLCFD